MPASNSSILALGLGQFGSYLRLVESEAAKQFRKIVVVALAHAAMLAG
jgi:hypothetical protein